jgi:hypothetical protein
MEKEKNSIAFQKQAFAETRRIKERLALEKIMRESLMQISFFTIPTLRQIRSVPELEDALASLSSNTKRKDLLKLFISMYRIGFGIETVSIVWSSGKDKKVGEYPDLLDRAKKICEKNYPIPDRPPIRKVQKATSPEDYGLTPTASYLARANECDEVSNDAITDVLELDEKYGVRLIYDWDSIQRQYWDVPLTDFMKDFRRDRIFKDEGRRWKVIGLSWDTKQDSYCAYFYELVARTAPPERMNDPNDRVAFAFFVNTTIGLKEYNSIANWGIEWED